MPSLQTQTRYINFIINKDNYCDNFESRLSDYLNSLGQYAFIKHDNDLQENGEVKRLHYHVVLIREKRTRLISQLNELCDVLGYRNNNGIQIEKIVSIESSIQYLIHKNDSLKFQYSKDKIITNLSNDELEVYLNNEIDNLSVSYVLTCITLNNGKLSAIIDQIGFARYKANRNVIMDIYKEWYEDNFSYRYNK